MYSVVPHINTHAFAMKWFYEPVQKKKDTKKAKLQYSLFPFSMGEN